MTQKARRVDDVIPEGMSDKWEKMVDLAAGRLYDKRKKVKEAIGDRPYRGLPVKEEELLSRFSQVWHDPQALAQILKQNAKFKPDGQVLIPKALIDAMKTMTSRLRKGGY